MLAALLCVCVALALQPAAAFAENTNSNIQLGTSGLDVGQKVFLGRYTENTVTYDVPWRVVKTDGFLLSEYLLGEKRFKDDGSNYFYQGSVLQGYIDTNPDSLYNTMFSAAEKSAIAEKTNLVCNDGPGTDDGAPQVPSAHLYALSYTEAAAIGWGTPLATPPITTPSAQPERWWLRSTFWTM